MCLDLGKKTEHRGNTPTNTDGARTCKLHTERQQPVDSNPGASCHETTVMAQLLYPDKLRLVYKTNSNPNDIQKWYTKGRHT